MDRYEGSYRIIGPPGTGKTSFLRKQVAAISEHDRVLQRGPKVMLCSLTRTAARQITSSMRDDEISVPSSAIGTIHAHCYRALNRPEIAETKLDDWNEFASEFKIASDSKIDVDEAACEWNPKTMGDKLAADYSLNRSRMIPREAWPNLLQKFAKLWERWKTEAQVMDFTDMIETCLRDMSTAPYKPRQIMADEGQDLSQLEYQLIRKWGKQANAEFIVGDPWQALYVWRGAHPELFFDPEITKDRVKILSQSYRVPKLIHDTATEWAQQLSDWQPIEYKPKVDEDGEVTRSIANWRNPDIAIKEAVKLVDDGESVMMMASCSYQLVNTIAVLRKKGIPFSNPWRIKRGDWNPLTRRKGGSTYERLLEFLRVDQVTFPDQPFWTLANLAAWVKVIKSKDILIRGVKKNIDLEAQVAPNDRVSEHDLKRFFKEAALDELLLIINDAKEGDELSTQRLIDWFDDKVMSDKKAALRFPINVIKNYGASALKDRPRLYVGTIHSYKGGECDNAFIFPDLSPAGHREWLGGGKARDNVVRMFYVALTRAKKRVVLCQPTGVSPIKIKLNERR